MSYESYSGFGRHPVTWGEQYCLNRECRGDRWYVRPDGRSLELWQVAESPEAAPFTVAASCPACPLCGESLEAHVEGVGEIATAPPATIMSFLRTIDRAA